MIILPVSGSLCNISRYSKPVGFFNVMSPSSTTMLDPDRRRCLIKILLVKHKHIFCFDKSNLLIVYA